MFIRGISSTTNCIEYANASDPRILFTPFDDACKLCLFVCLILSLVFNLSALSCLAVFLSFFLCKCPMQWCAKIVLITPQQSVTPSICRFVCQVWHSVLGLPFGPYHEWHTCIQSLCLRHCVSLSIRPSVFLHYGILYLNCSTAMQKLPHLGHRSTRLLFRVIFKFHSMSSIICWDMGVIHHWSLIHDWRFTLYGKVVNFKAF